MRKVFDMILLTGGAGYIGSHVCIALLDAGLDVVAVDNLSNGNKASLERVQSICGRSLVFRHVDIRDEEAIYEILRAYGVTAVIHLAGLKAVGDSNARPLTYYENNVLGTMRLVSAMKKAKVKTLVFSSSATVYGVPRYLPLDEKHPLEPTNPYGRTKFFIEEMLRDIYRSNEDWRIGILRYFNPVGAHESGFIGEDPLGVPNNLLPFVAQVAIGKREKLLVWGNDYDTPDGTAIRDFIHVVDLASGHLSVLSHLKQPGLFTVNLGTGNGSSVLEVIRTFERVSGRSVPYEIGERRTGDVAVCYADPTLAKEALGWKSARSLAQMCADHWRWQLQNPNGYRGIELLKVQKRSRPADRHRRASAPEVLSKRRMVRPHERA
jgi:UDP-glucose 4-epimerase